MAGEYYRYLARDVKPQEKRELTPREKRQNWWHYHKWHLVIGLVCAAMLASVVSGAVRNKRNEPDYRIAFVGKTALPEDTREALELALARLGEDLTGNGKVQVEILPYSLPDTEQAVDALDMERAAEQAYSEAMRLLVNVQTAESIIYLLEEPELFQAQYPILEQPWYPWTGCPVAAGLELGTFELPMVGGMAVGDSRKVMESVYIARRDLTETGTNDIIEGAVRLFDILTEGAT